MKVNNILYITDNMLYLKHKDNIIKHKLNKGIVVLNKIANIKKFIKTYEEVMKIHKLNNSLFGDIIKIIVPSNYLSSDINTLKNIFSYLNYRKVIIVKENYKLTNNNCYLKVLDNYLTINYLNIYKERISLLITYDMFKNEDDLMKYIKYVIDDKELFLIGNGDVLFKLFNTFEDSFSNRTYLYTNHEYYLLESV